MAVRQLAGPFPLAHTDGTPVMAYHDFDRYTRLYSNLGFAQWVPGVGLVTLLEGYYSTVTLDGVAALLNGFDTGTRFVNAFWTYVVSEGKLKTVMTGGERNREPIALIAYDVAGPFGSYIPYTIQSAFDLNDRRLLVLGQQVTYQNAALGNPRPPLYVDCAEPTGTDNNPSVGIGRSTSEMFIASVNTGNDLRFRLYDTIGRAFSTQILHLGIGAQTAVFAQEFGVVVSIDGDGQVNPFMVRVWSLDVVPDHLAPVVQLGGTLAQGATTTFQTRVLGAQGEWCAGEFVSWTLTGPGTLLYPQTVSDQSGYAMTSVLHSGDAGNVEVAASLLC